MVVINQGALVYQGSSEAFLGQAAPTIHLAPEQADDLPRLAAMARAEGLEADRQGPGVIVQVNGHDPQALAATLNRWAMAAGMVLAELYVRRPTLESHYLGLVEGGTR